MSGFDGTIALEHMFELIESIANGQSSIEPVTDTESGFRMMGYKIDNEIYKLLAQNKDALVSKLRVANLGSGDSRDVLRMSADEVVRAILDTDDIDDASSISGLPGVSAGTLTDALRILYTSIITRHVITKDELVSAADNPYTRVIDGGGKVFALAEDLYIAGNKSIVNCTVKFTAVAKGIYPVRQDDIDPVAYIETLDMSEVFQIHLKGLHNINLTILNLYSTDAGTLEQFTGLNYVTVHNLDGFANVHYENVTFLNEKNYTKIVGSNPNGIGFRNGCAVYADTEASSLLPVSLKPLIINSDTDLSKLDIYVYNVKNNQGSYGSSLNTATAVYKSGIIEHLDFTLVSEGSIIYVDMENDIGNWTTEKPKDPYRTVELGRALNGNTTEGRLLINIKQPISSDVEADIKNRVASHPATDVTKYSEQELCNGLYYSAFTNGESDGDYGWNNWGNIPNNPILDIGELGRSKPGKISNIRIILDLGEDKDVSSIKYINYITAAGGDTNIGIQECSLYIADTNWAPTTYFNNNDGLTRILDQEILEIANSPTDEQIIELYAPTLTRYIVVDSWHNHGSTEYVGLRSLIAIAETHDYTITIGNDDVDETVLKGNVYGNFITNTYSKYYTNKGVARGYRQLMEFGVKDVSMLVLSDSTNVDDFVTDKKWTYLFVQKLLADYGTTHRIDYWTFNKSTEYYDTLQQFGQSGESRYRVDFVDSTYRSHILPNANILNKWTSDDLDETYVISFDALSGSDQQAFVSMQSFNDGDTTFGARLLQDGTLEYSWSTDGTTANRTIVTSSVGWALANMAVDTKYYIRCRIDVDNGSGQHVVTMEVSTDNTTWSYAINETIAGTTSINRTTPSEYFYMGTRDYGKQDKLKGYVYDWIFNDGIDGPRISPYTLDEFKLESVTTDPAQTDAKNACIREGVPRIIVFNGSTTGMTYNDYVLDERLQNAVTPDATNLLTIIGWSLNGKKEDVNEYLDRWVRPFPSILQTKTRNPVIMYMTTNLFYDTAGTTHTADEIALQKERICGLMYYASSNGNEYVDTASRLYDIDPTGDIVVDIDGTHPSLAGSTDQADLFYDWWKNN